MSLLKAMSYFPNAKERIQLQIAGGHGDEEEYKKIVYMAEECPCEVIFLGNLSQVELAKVFNRQIFCVTIVL